MEGVLSQLMCALSCLFSIEIAWMLLFGWIMDESVMVKDSKGRIEGLQWVTSFWVAHHLLGLFAM